MVSHIGVLALTTVLRTCSGLVTVKWLSMHLRWLSLHSWKQSAVGQISSFSLWKNVHVVLQCSIRLIKEKGWQLLHTSLWFDLLTLLFLFCFCFISKTSFSITPHFSSVCPKDIFSREQSVFACYFSQPLNLIICNFLPYTYIFLWRDLKYGYASVTLPFFGNLPIEILQL